MFAWEADRFPAHRLEPLLVVADAGRQRLVALAYEQDAQVCPNYDEEVGCTIYEDRPLVCQAYPLLVVEGEEGAEVAVSGLCPGKVPIARAAERADRPEPVLARAYPDEFAAALAVPATVQALSEVVGFLESAGVLDPVDGLTEDAIDRWRAKGTVDLVTIVEEAGVLGQEQLAERTRRIRRTIHERWADAGSGA